MNVVPLNCRFCPQTWDAPDPPDDPPQLVALATEIATHMRAHGEEDAAVRVERWAIGLRESLERQAVYMEQIRRFLGAM